MSLRSLASAYLRDARSGFRRAPVEVLATLWVALTFSLAVESGDPAFPAWFEILVSALLMLAIAWTGTLLEAAGVWSARRRWIVTLAGVLVAGAYALTFADFRYEAEGWRAALLVGAAVLWLVALPAFAGPRAGRVERMRTIDGRVLLRLIGAYLYGAALFAGLALALAAVDSLFELELDGEIYGHVFGWIWFALVPWIVLGGLGDYLRPLEEKSAVASVAQRIVLYLVPPLLAIYYVILFAYVARILITGEVPKNLVSPLVLAAGGLSALALLLFDPRPGERGLGRWLRVTPALFVPVAALGFWAIVQRTDQYGLTEFRVIRFAVLTTLTLLAIAGAMWLIRRRAFALHVIPLVLAAVALLGPIGPWSALALPRRSQEARLEASLAAVGIAPDDTGYVAPPDTAARVVPAAAYEGIRGSAQYLAQHFGPDALPPVLRRHAAGDGEGRWAEYPMLLGLRPDSVAEEERGTRLGGFLPMNTPFRIETAGTAYRVSWPQYAGQAPAGPRPASDVVITLLDSTRLALRTATTVVYADARPLIDDIRGSAQPRRGPGAVGPLPAMPLPLTDSAGATRGQLVLWTFWLQPDSADEARIGNFEGLAIIRD
jgi:hypothetical protein